MIKIELQPEGRVLEVKAGTNLMKALQKNGVRVKSPCGGKGTCKKCKVEILDGTVFRKVLSCQVKVREDLVVRVDSDQHLFADRKSTLNNANTIPVDGTVRAKDIQVPPVANGEKSASLDRLLEALGGEKKVSLELLKRIPSLVDSKGAQLQAVWEHKRLLGLFPQTGGRYGIAVDIGTTTVVCQLIDLDNGAMVGVCSDSNPQGETGADVISRVGYQAEDPANSTELQDMILETVNAMTGRLVREAGITSDRVFKAVFCGNTVMLHLFLGLDARQIAHAPYVPPMRSAGPFRAKELGLAICPDARVHLLPSIAGYVGGDTTAMILSLGLDRTKKTVLAVDIGTNGEIVLAHKRELYTCSTAAGPAFEGAVIEFGMRADEGAIERVHIGPGTYRLETIGKAPASGLCGSGLIDAVSHFRQTGLIDARGKIVKPDLVPPESAFLVERIGTWNNLPAILVAAEAKGAQTDIWLTQSDIRELQLGKAAILAGVSRLMKMAGLAPEDVDKVVLAGAFGNYISPDSALGIRMLPEFSRKTIKPVGNAAGWGAALCLGSAKQRARALKISQQAGYLELSVDPDFHSTFMDAIMF